MLSEEVPIGIDIPTPVALIKVTCEAAGKTKGTRKEFSITAYASKGTEFDLSSWTLETTEEETFGNSSDSAAASLGLSYVEEASSWYLIIAMALLKNTAVVEKT